MSLTLFFPKIVLAIRGLLGFHTGFRIFFFSINVKKAIGILIGVVLNLCNTLTILILLIHDWRESRISFHLFVSVISFSVFYSF